MKTLVFDKNSIETFLSEADISDDWFENDCPKPASLPNIVRIEENDVVYFLNESTATVPPAGFLVLNATPSTGIQSIHKENQIEALQRILRLTESCFNRQISIPAHWRPYNSGSRISIQSNSLASGERARIEADRSPNGTRNIFVYFIGTRQNHKDLGQVGIPLNEFSEILDNIPSIESKATIERTNKETNNSLHSSINHDSVTLHQLNHQSEANGLSFNDWYKSRLTDKQKLFVDYTNSKSVRLIGPAGTGKTVALAARVVRIVNESANQKESSDINLLILTHNTSAVDNLDRLIRSMDADGRILESFDNGKIRLCTLYELAYNFLGYQERQIEPIAIEGLKGRAEQITVMGWAINSLKETDWPILQNGCSENFISWINLDQNSPEGRAFSFELLNEFTNFIDADGYNQHDKRKKYVDLKKRPNWLLELSSPNDREVVLYLYDRFRNHLRSLGLVGTDQMITDFLGFLNSFGWDAIRGKTGFDFIFVDEMHLFNKQDQMVLDHLQRDPLSNPTISMAYDSKQSPRDTFRNIENYFADISRQTTEKNKDKITKIELVDVFRYTPEILEALRSIDENFPAVDLEDGWPAYSGISKRESGEKPSITCFRDYRDTYTRVFSAASARRFRGKSSNSVAVLCCDPERFNEYVSAGALRDLCLPIVERDQIEKIRHAGRRFILSMPEYVAGLQFDEVFLVDVNHDMAKATRLGHSALRKFISVVYLGASRAERYLHFISAEDGGGYPMFINKGITNQTLLEVESTTFDNYLKGL